MNSGVFDGYRKISADLLTFLCHYLACLRIDNVLSGNNTVDSVRDTKFFIVLISAHFSQIVTLRIKEKRVEQGPGALHRRRLGRSQLLIDFFEAFFVVGGGILLKSLLESRVFSEDFKDLLIASKAQGSQQSRHRLFSRTVDSYRNYLVGVGLIFQPRSSVRYYGGGKQLVVGFVISHVIVRSRRTNKLRHHNSLGAVIYEGSLLCHQRKISHEHFLFFDFSGLFVDEPNFYFKRSSVCHVSFLTFFLFIFRSIGKGIVDKL